MMIIRNRSFCAITFVLAIVALCVTACGEDDDSYYTVPSARTPEGVYAVDLGLPSGRKWANMNVGASRPTDYGLYFAWGETVGYKCDKYDNHKFDWDSYKWSEGDDVYSRFTKYGRTIRYSTLRMMLPLCTGATNGDFPHELSSQNCLLTPRKNGLR